MPKLFGFGYYCFFLNHPTALGQSVYKSQCLPVDVWKTRFPVDERLLVEDCIANNFVVVSCWSSQTSLLCIVGELAGRRSVAVAVGISNRL